MTRRYLYAYNPNSEGAKELARALEIKRIKHGPGSNFIDHPSRTVINWGSSSLPYTQCRVLNTARAVGLIGNKRSAFEAFDGHTRLPPWTTDPEVAREWVQSGRLVVGRTKLTGHSGEGIVIIENSLDFVQAPLYTGYIKKEKEYRIHCAFGHVIDIQQKIRDPGREPTDWKVRNHANGFIYVRNNIVVPEDAKVQALLAFESSGLDFGAVDVIWNQHEQKAYVLEINTAPGLTGTTIQRYAEAFKSAFANP